MEKYKNVNIQEDKNQNSNEYEFNPETTYTKQDIAKAVSICTKNMSELIRPTTELKNMVYYILKSFFVDKKKYVIANCPTGSGKTIIGFMVYFCTQYLEAKSTSTNPRINAIKGLGYYLTSNKVLQEQIADDINRFDFHDYLYLLKGTNNYECIDANDKFKNPVTDKDIRFKNRVLAKHPDALFASYEFRPCAGLASAKIEEKFKCFGNCPYKRARDIASEISCTILNYAYFLNVMRAVDDGNPNKYFYRRKITICDEAHLIPDIVCNMFNHEYTQTIIRRVRDLINRIKGDFGFRASVEKMDYVLNPCFKFFYKPINGVSEFLNYLDDLEEVDKLLEEINKEYKNETYERMYSADVKDLRDQIKELIFTKKSLENLFNERPEDVYFESELVADIKTVGARVYKHILKDLKEAELVKTNMLDKMEYGLFMSATLGDMDEYAKLMGMKDDEYTTLFLPSTFDFSKSPIYLCESGYLNYNSFDRNIDKVLMDAIKICNQHRNEKGVIHTATFKITELLKEKIFSLGNAVDTSRFLFYQNTQEKELLIDQFKNSMIPYIFIGPSLYEGIDLPDDKCRFQILIKVPYAQMNPYIKKKIERYPFWYNRNCIEKIIQAIGRSNRHKNDYSKIYLLDSCFDKIIYQIDDDKLQERIEYRKIY